MRISITEKNTARINAALQTANGSAVEHTYFDADQIIAVAFDAERKLAAILPVKSKRQGAIYDATSGDAVARCYKYSRNATHVRLVRGVSGWFLTSVNRVTLWERGCNDFLILTLAQDAAALASLRKGYSVLGEFTENGGILQKQETER